MSLSFLMEAQLAPWLRAGSVYVRLGRKDYFWQWGA